MTDILKQFAELSNMSEDDFKSEIFFTYAALMSLEMEKSNSAEMSITYPDYVLTLTKARYHKFKSDIGVKK